MDSKPNWGKRPCRMIRMPPLATASTQADSVSILPPAAASASGVSALITTTRIITASKPSTATMRLMSRMTRATTSASRSRTAGRRSIPAPPALGLRLELGGQPDYQQRSTRRHLSTPDAAEERLRARPLASVYSSPMIVMLSGMMPPAPRPCTARAAISCSIVCDAPAGHRADEEQRRPRAGTSGGGRTGPTAGPRSAPTPWTSAGRPRRPSCSAPARRASRSRRHRRADHRGFERAEAHAEQQAGGDGLPALAELMGDAACSSAMRRKAYHAR